MVKNPKVVWTMVFSGKEITWTFPRGEKSNHL